MSPHKKEECRAEIELILLGVALAKSPDRQRVLDAFPQGSFGKVRDEVLNAIRQEDKDPVVRFVEARGATVEKGKDIVQSLIDVAYDQNTVKRVADATKGLFFGGEIDEIPGYIDKLKRALEKLEGLGIR